MDILQITYVTSTHNTEYSQRNSNTKMMVYISICTSAKNDNQTIHLPLLHVNDWQLCYSSAAYLAMCMVCRAVLRSHTDENMS